MTKRKELDAAAALARQQATDRGDAPPAKKAKMTGAPQAALEVPVEKVNGSIARRLRCSMVRFHAESGTFRALTLYEDGAWLDG